MPKIKFSYTFSYNLERIVACFVEVNYNIEYKNLISNFKFLRGRGFDEEKTEFSLCWKNYYNINMIVDKVIKEPSYNCFIIRSTFIDKVPFQLSLIYNFYWDSINENTIFILEIEYQDEFFTDLIKNDFNEEDKLNICKQIEKYLNSSLKGLETYICTYLNTTLDKVEKYILYPYLFFEIVTKDNISIPNKNEISLDEVYDIFTIFNDSSNIVPLTSYIVTDLIISSNYIKVTYKTYKTINFPDIKVMYSIQALGNKRCLFSINIKPIKPITNKMNSSIFLFWKKNLTIFSEHFEKRKSENNKRIF